jgi:thiol-disulfide isomerase/thioredoxin
LNAAGWVNGPPPRPRDPGVNLLVVDVWAAWCPACRSNSPALVELQAKYAARGVRFVGLSNINERGVKQYSDDNRLAWANGYDTPAELIVALGAGSGQRMPGYQIAPTVYLVGPDGKVRWSDQRARMQRVGRAEWQKALDAAIAAALDARPPIATKNPSP